MLLTQYFAVSQIVALFTRAWIEIEDGSLPLWFKDVALFTRAWIEINKHNIQEWIKMVALFTRAWIEMPYFFNSKIITIGRPLHEGVD